MTEVIAKRQFDPLYIWLDVLFLCVFALLLLWRKKYTTVLVGLFARSFIYGCRLRHFSPTLRRKGNIRRLQSVLGAFMDVDELRLYKFHVDLALDLKGSSSF